MTGKKVSKQQVQIMAVFAAEPLQWFTVSQIVTKTEVSINSCQPLMFKLTELKLLQRVEGVVGYRYRLSPTAKDQSYWDRVQEARIVMGIPEKPTSPLWERDSLHKMQVE
jgi:DNA-binding IscR family transcriptional regulator